MKLWVRVTIASTLLILVTLTSLGGLLFVIEKHHLLNLTVQQQDESVQRLTQVCLESFLEQSDLIVLNYILALSKSPGIRYASFINLESKIVIHNALIGQISQDEMTTQLLKGSSSQLRHQIQGAVEEVGCPILNKGKKIGVAKIGYDRAFFQNQVQSTLHATMIRLGYVCAIVTILGILGSILFARTMTRPIQKLAEATKIIGKGELTHRIAVNRSDEIGQLAYSFNDMAKKLQELDEMKNDFVSSVNHELRSPLSALKGFLQMFQLGISGPLNDQQKKNVGLMMECTERLNRFVSNILDVAKLEAGMMEFNLEPLDPVRVADEIVELFQPQAKMEKINLFFESAPRISKISGDSDRLKQVFTNLINNAMKFTPEEGKIIVWARENENSVILGVTDTGAGIPKEAIPKLFNKFEQVKQTKEKAKSKGTGLGLTIVKQIVEGMGGKIGVESELNKGTTFFFSLPKWIDPSSSSV